MSNRSKRRFRRSRPGANLRARWTGLTIDERFRGIDRLYGAGSAARLAAAHVCIVGIGGVGSWAVEALARSGVGRLTLIDADDVCVSNTNRQLHALDGEYGRAKVEVMAARARAINPAIEVDAIAEFLTPIEYRRAARPRLRLRARLLRRVPRQGRDDRVVPAAQDSADRLGFGRRPHRSDADHRARSFEDRARRDARAGPQETARGFQLSARAETLFRRAGGVFAGERALSAGRWQRLRHAAGVGGRRVSSSIAAAGSVRRRMSLRRLLSRRCRGRSSGCCAKTLRTRECARCYWPIPNNRSAFAVVAAATDSRDSPRNPAMQSSTSTRHAGSLRSPRCPRQRLIRRIGFEQQPFDRHRRDDRTQPSGALVCHRARRCRDESRVSRTGAPAPRCRRNCARRRASRRRGGSRRRLRRMRAARAGSPADRIRARARAGDRDRRIA